VDFQFSGNSITQLCVRKDGEVLAAMRPFATLY
jgi:hypothetical protein